MIRQSIGVVTVTYNSANVLNAFLLCVFAQTHNDFFLFAVDNASTDGTLDILRTCEDSRLTLIGNSENMGVAEGNNQGIRAALNAGCSSVLLLNNDTEFDSVLFEKLTKGLEHYQSDMLCPKMLFFDEPDRLWCAGGAFQPRLGYRTFHYGEGTIDRGQFDEVRQVTYVPTCCVLIRANAFTTIGLMDRRYFVYVDDVDFMYRAMRAGLILVYLPDARLLHKVGRLTGGAESPFSIRYAARNRAFFALKHFGGFTSALFLLMQRGYYLYKLLTFNDSLSKFRLKLRAMCEARGMLKDTKCASSIGVHG